MRRGRGRKSSKGRKRGGLVSVVNQAHTKPGRQKRSYRN